MSKAQRRVGLATVLAVAVVASGFGPIGGPVQAEPAPPAGKLPAEPPEGVLDDPALHAPELPAPMGLGGTSRGPLLEQRPGWDDDHPGIAKVPKWTQEDTLGYTFKDSDMRVWKHEKQGPFEFQIDMGDFANKDQLTKNHKGYWLQLLLPTNVAGIQGYFLVDGDGKFDPFNDPNKDGMGDEPCHPNKKFDILKVFVNNKFVHTLQGHKETGCGVGEGPRQFELIPMTQGEPANVFRVPVDVVTKGKNTVRIELQDVPFIHPNRGLIRPDDGWFIYLTGAAMQLVAPPLIISGGWSFNIPPGGHEVTNSGWEDGLAEKITNFFTEYFGQSPWTWDISPSSIYDAGLCSQGGGVQSTAKGEYTRKGMVYIAKDGKQDFRVTGCQVARIIRDAESTFGYGYKKGKDPVGFWYIGFSMGGLIGRWAVQREQLNGMMSKFVTLGTPHGGSHWADLYVELMDVKGWYRELDGDRLCKICLGPFKFWKDWENNNVQARYFEKNKPRLTYVGFPPFGHLDWTFDSSGQLLDHRADFELKRWGNEILNGLNMGGGMIADRTLAVSGQGGTMAGDIASVLTKHPAVQVVKLLAEGDGVVPSWSAKHIYKSTECPAVHHGGVYSYFDSCVFPAFEHFTGFLGKAAAGAQGGDGDTPLPTAETANLFFTLVPDPATGEAEAEGTVPVDASPWGLFTATWPDDGALRFTLVSPSGQEYTPENVTALGAGFNVEASDGPVRALYVVPDIAPGDWKVRFAATEDTPAWGTAVSLLAHVNSPVELSTQAPMRVSPGEAVVLTARLDGAATGVAMEARVLPADVTLALHDDGLDGDAVAGDGVWSLRYADTADLEDVAFVVTATGTSASGAFERVDRAATQVAHRKDVAVTSLVVDAHQVWWGEAAQATAIIENTGEADIGDVTVVWNDDSDTTRLKPLQEHLSLGPLAKGESRTVTLPWLATPGLRTLTLSAWAGGLEENLDDNTRTATLDVLPSPRTVAHISGPQGQNGWYTGPVTVTLGPWDADPAPPILSTWYSVDGAPWLPSLGAFQVTGDGHHTLEFYAIDLQGRQETVRTATISIDATAPTVGLRKPVLGINVGGVSVPAPVSRPVVAGIVEVVVPNGDAMSGVARVEIRLDGLKMKEVTDPPAEVSMLWDTTTSSTGRHTLTVVAVDHAGLSSTASVQVYVTASRALQVENNPNAMIARLSPPLG